MATWGGVLNPSRMAAVPLIMLLVYVAIFFRGAGRCSLDRWFGKEF